MKAIKVVLRISFLLLVIGLWMQPIVGAHSTELKAINVELESCMPVFSGKDNICLVPIFKLSNPNDQSVSATMDYTLSLAGQILGSAQMPTIYIPSGGTGDQKDIVVMVYRSWFARLYFQGNSPGEALKIILPLWKGMGGKEPAKVPKGMWSNISATTSQIIAEGSITLVAADGTERVFFFKDMVN